MMSTRFSETLVYTDEFTERWNTGFQDGGCMFLQNVGIYLLVRLQPKGNMFLSSVPISLDGVTIQKDS